MPRSLFRMGIVNELLRRGQAVGPISVHVTKEEIAASGYKLLRRANLPPGWTGSYPYIVKVNTTGEYIVYADGTAQYLDYRTGRSDEIIDIR